VNRGGLSPTSQQKIVVRSSGLHYPPKPRTQCNVVKCPTMMDEGGIRTEQLQKLGILLLPTRPV
jgi:hypothetical protein